MAVSGANLRSRGLAHLQHGQAVTLAVRIRRKSHFALRTRIANGGSEVRIFLGAPTSE